MSIRRIIKITSIIVLSAFYTSTFAQTNVDTFAPSTNTDPGVWYENDVRQAGTATVVDLTGAGGDLETNQPLPSFAARLTTGSDTGDKAEVGVINDYGMPMDTFASLAVAYSFLKATNPGQNLTAAPSIKLTFFNTICDDVASAGDCFGTLVYEPSWNGPGSSTATPLSSQPALDVWTAVNIDQNNGLFWWTGGFGQPNTAGGPPIRTLADWLTQFSTDFADSTLIQVSVGVGTFNVDQLGYFDDVQISHTFGGGLSESYNFEPLPLVPPMPIPTLGSISQILLLASLLLLGGLSIRSRIHHYQNNNVWK